MTPTLRLTVFFLRPRGSMGPFAPAAGTVSRPGPLIRRRCQASRGMEANGGRPPCAGHKESALRPAGVSLKSAGRGRTGWDLGVYARPLLLSTTAFFGVVDLRSLVFPLIPGGAGQAFGGPCPPPGRNPAGTDRGSCSPGPAGVLTGPGQRRGPSARPGTSWCGGGVGASGAARFDHPPVAGLPGDRGTMLGLATRLPPRVSSSVSWATSAQDRLDCRGRSADPVGGPGCAWRRRCVVSAYPA